MIFNQRAITPTGFAGWRDVYLAHQSPSCTLERSLGDHKPWRSAHFLELLIDTPFCFSRERIRGLAIRDAISVVTGKTPVLPWTGAEPLMLAVTFVGLVSLSCPLQDYAICVGRCTNRALGFSSDNLGPHWLTMTSNDFASVGEHSCSMDHIPIPEWPSIIWRAYQAESPDSPTIYAGVEQCSFNPERLIVTLTDDSRDAMKSSIRASMDSPITSARSDNMMTLRRPDSMIVQRSRSAP